MLRVLRRGLLALVLVALVLAAVAVFLSWQRPRGGRVDRLPAGWQKGFNVTAYRPHALSRPVAQRALRSLRATGTTDVALVTQWYMTGPRSNAVAPDRAKTPSDQSLLSAMREARRLGLSVMLKPHVDLRDGSFRGDIRPRDTAAWFASYRAMIAHYAQLAARGEARSFVVGVELTSMARHEDEFRHVIAEARGRFPGQLTFAANWSSGAEQVGFWDALDAIGIDAYMPLSHHPDPTVAELVAAWRHRWVGPIRRLSERRQRPVLFTELGYQSWAGAAQSPHAAHGPVSQVAQARAYEAAYRVWSVEPGFQGIYWWDWPADGDPAGSAAGSFSPAGKRAEAVVRFYDGAPPLPAPAKPRKPAKRS
jgi:hypothetical protein